MKARFFAIAALVLGMASCAKDFAPEANLGGEVDFTLAVSAPELAATRADGDAFAGHNSAYGAIDYLSDAEWAEEVDLRYTLEIYDVADDYTNAKPIKDRQVQIVDKYKGVTFETRLAPNRNYHFVVFADFVDAKQSTDNPAIEAQRTIGMRHDIGDNLTQITIKNDDINDEYADAYFGTMDYKPENNTYNKVEKPMVLTRPYAKMRVVATDLHELNLNVDPGYVKVVYDAYHPSTFNAVNGDISGKYVKEFYKYDYPETLTKEDLSSYKYTNGYEEKTTTSADGYVRHTHMTLFTDYILAEDNQESRPFTMLVVDKKGNPIKETAFNTEIPVQRNHLTTIIGNVLTTATEVDVTIDDNFANADSQNWVFEAFVNGGEVTLDQDYTIGSTLFVEPGAEVVLNLNGKKIKNTKDNQLTDVIVVKEGGKLTINGNGSIEAVNGNDGYAVISEGELIINGGTFTSGVDANGDSNAIIYARGNGKVYINGGFFNRNGSSNDGSFVLNKKDSDRATTVIEVSGGKFRKFNPEDNAAEGAGTNFLAPGYTVIEYAPNYFEVVVARDIDLFLDHAEVYSAEGLLQWAYIVNNGGISAFDGLEGYVAADFDKKAYGLKVMTNINMPAKTVVADAAKETYVFTDEAIEVIDGVATGSNWIPVCGDVSALSDGYRGWVDGQNKKISGLRINYTSSYVGFFGLMFDSEGASVKNVTFDDAVVKGASYVGVVAGLAQNGITIDNIKIANSKVVGTGNNVGGVVGRNYRRWKPEADIYEQLSVVSNCSTDKNTTVKGVNYVGGIVGKNYGAVVMDCVNNADVEGSAGAGGIVGRNRTYWHGAGAYVVGCYSSADAVIRTTSTNEYQNGVGGIVGYAHMNDEHNLSTPSANVWVVACASESEVYGLFKGGLVGHAAAENATVTAVCASWASSKLGGKEDTRYDGAFVFASPADATQAEVDAMNQAIVNFNGSNENSDNINYLKSWVLTANGPVLQ